MEKTIEDSLAEFKLKTQELSVQLDKSSKIITGFEASMKESKLNFKYEHIIDEYHFLIWQPQLSTKKETWRLFAGIHMDNGKDLVRPLCEMPVDHRFYFLPFLKDFIQAYSTSIEAKINSFKDL